MGTYSHSLWTEQWTVSSPRHPSNDSQEIPIISLLCIDGMCVDTACDIQGKPQAMWLVKLSACLTLGSWYTWHHPLRMRPSPGGLRRYPRTRPSRLGTLTTILSRFSRRCPREVVVRCSMQSERKNIGKISEKKKNIGAYQCCSTTTNFSPDISGDSTRAWHKRDQKKKIWSLFLGQSQWSELLERDQKKKIWSLFLGQSQWSDLLMNRSEMEEWVDIAK